MKTRTAIAHSVEQSRLAYLFSPGSYTYGAFQACLSALAELDAEPVWTDEYLDWMQR